jgi:hypothetical protein
MTTTYTFQNVSLGVLTNGAKFQLILLNHFSDIRLSFLAAILSATSDVMTQKYKILITWKKAEL